MGKLGVLVGEFLEVEEARAGNMRVGKQRAGIGVFGRQVETRVEHGEIGLAQLGREPGSVHQRLHGNDRHLRSISANQRARSASREAASHNNPIVATEFG